MDIEYSENTNWTLPYWIDWQVDLPNDNMNLVMDINQWCADHCGELGTLWGYERRNMTRAYPAGLNPVHVRNQYSYVHYSWRFKNKQDAMLMKLTWGGR